MRRAAVGERQGGFDVRRCSWRVPSGEVAMKTTGRRGRRTLRAARLPARACTCGRSSFAVRLLARQQQVQQVVVRQIHQRARAPSASSSVRPASCASKKRVDEQVVLEQAAAAAPAQLAQRGRVRRIERCVRSSRCGSVDAAVHQTARRTISSLILPIALVGFRPFGQTSTQFMIVWQRNRRYGSSRLSRRSLVAWSRLSAMKR